MEEIKYRDRVISELLQKKFTTGQPMIDIELACLNFRKICELVAISSICAHRDVFEKLFVSIEKEWNATKIFKKIRNVHPKFYPIPFERVIENGKPVNKAIDNDFLTEESCKSVIGRCGDLLHGFNPYGHDQKFNRVRDVESKFTDWLNSIRNLLKAHEIVLYKTNKRLWVYMDRGDGKVYVEERVPT